MYSGKVSEILTLEAFTMGADGVLAGSCHPRDYHYLKSNLSASTRVTGLKPFLGAVGIDKDEPKLEWLSASEDSKIAKAINSFTQTIKRPGPSRLEGRGD